MTDASANDLSQRLRALLEPGDIDLIGCIIHTGLGRDDEIEMHEITVDVGDIVAEHVGVDDWYVYSGNDDPEFASNQHQGRRVSDEGFVWECQHLLREGSFDIVMYYRAALDQGALLDDISAAGYRVTGVTPADS